MSKRPTQPNYQNFRYCRAPHLQLQEYYPLHIPVLSLVLLCHLHVCRTQTQEFSWRKSFGARQIRANDCHYFSFCLRRPCIILSVDNLVHLTQWHFVSTLCDPPKPTQGISAAIKWGPSSCNLVLNMIDLRKPCQGLCILGSLSFTLNITNDTSTQPS